MRRYSTSWSLRNVSQWKVTWEWKLYVQRQCSNGAINFVREESSLKILPILDLHVLEYRMKIWDNCKLFYPQIGVLKLRNLLKHRALAWQLFIPSFMALTITGYTFHLSIRSIINYQILSFHIKLLPTLSLGVITTDQNPKVGPNLRQEK